MKKSFIRVFLLLMLLMIPFSMSSRPAINKLGDLNGKKFRAIDKDKTHEDANKALSRSTMVQSAGSRLPDCSHACGSCMPCRLIIVGSVCASLTEAESCPISYRCMCNNKTYPVP